MLVALTGCRTLPTPSPATRTPVPEVFQPEDDGGEFCPPPRAWYVYVVQPGDTIRELADRTNSTVNLLAAANCLQNPRMLAAGQRFYVPRELDN